MEIDLEEIEALMEAMERHDIAVLKVKEGEQEIKLEHASRRVAPVAAAPVPATPPPVPPKDEPPAAEAGKWIPSPMVGTFYRASSPDADPFVKEGDTVSEETIVCIIEAMKVMNEVKAGVSGTIAKVKPNSGDPVEFGSELFLIS